MKKIFLLILAFAAFTSCESDDSGTLTPSNADEDWYAIEDSADPLDHARYEIYKEYGISVFYDDMIGTQKRGIDGYGDSIIHVERLDPFYNVTYTQSNIEYKLSTDREMLLQAVEMLHDTIIPGMVTGHYPRTILLVDELTYTNPINAEIREDDIYIGYHCTIISKVSDLRAMTSEQKDEYSTRVLATVWYEYALKNYPAEMQRFFDVSENVWVPNNNPGDINTGIYEKLMNTYTVMPGQPVGIAAYYRDNWMCYGFLVESGTHTAIQPGYGAKPGVYTQWKAPSQLEDGVSFIIAAWSYANVNDFDADNASSVYNTPPPTLPIPNYTNYTTGNQWLSLLTDKFNIIQSIVEQIKTDTVQ